MARKRIPKKVIQLVHGYTNRLQHGEGLPIVRVLLFGSWAHGAPHRGSDIDVCVISPRFKDPLATHTFLWGKRNRAEVIAGLEPIGLTPMDFRTGGSLINEIKRTGVNVGIIQKS